MWYILTLTMILAMEGLHSLLDVVVSGITATATTKEGLSIRAAKVAVGKVY